MEESDLELDDLARKAHTPTRYGPARYGPPAYGTRRISGGKYGDRPGATRY